MRTFGGGHDHHDEHDDHHDDHGHGDHGHDDHHHHEIVKAEPDHKFIRPFDKKMLALTGMKGTSNVMVELINPYAHQNNLPLSQ